MEIKDIQDYVRHTPGNTNPAVLGSMIKELGSSGGGLPDPTGLTDGTAIVAVNGQWKMQEGYGYTGDPAFEPITWDGNTEGRESINEGISFKVAEELDITALDGSVLTLSGVYSDEALFVSTEEIMPNYYIAWYGDTGIVIMTDDVDVGEGIIYHKGVYFPYGEGYYASALTPAPSVHKFDPALIPSVDYTVTFSLDEDGEAYTCDKTLDEIFANSNNAKFVLELDGVIFHATAEMVEPSLPLVNAVFIILANDELQNYLITYNDDGVSGSSASYTLTPDT